MRTRLGLFTLALSLLFVPTAAAAQSGSIVGTVTDEDDRPVIGVSVFVEGTGYGAVTDARGRYRILAVPAGTATVISRSIGFVEGQQTVAVRAGEISTADFRLGIAAVELEGIEVVGQREGQARALNLQKTSDNIVNIVASEAIGRFPDPNTAEAVQRLPGVGVLRDQGEGRFVLVRGTEPRLSSVSINGQRIPAPEGDIRYVALDVIPSDQLASIEVSKTLTPDRDADAIGGSVNLVTKTATRPGFTFDATAAGGLNDLTNGGILQLGGTLANRSADNRLGVLLSGSYYRTDRGSENMEQEFFEDDFGSGDVTLLDDLQFRDYQVLRERIGVSAGIDYALTSEDNLWVRGMFNDFSDQEFRRRNRIRPGKGDYTSGSAVTGAEIERELKDRFEAQQIWHGSAGGNHTLGRLSLDFSAAYSYAEESEPDRLDINFIQEDFDLSIDRSDPDLPIYSIQNGAAREFDNPSFEFDELVLENNLTTDKEFAARVNLGLPYRLGSFVGELRFGGNIRDRKKDRRNDVRVFDGYSDGDLDLGMFAGTYENMDFFGGRYRIGQTADPDGTREFVRQNLESFEEDSDASREDTDPANYDADEQILAGYVMTTLDSGPFRLIPGVRVERTKVDYVGNEVVFDDNGDYEATNQVPGGKTYTNWFPGVNAVLALSDRTNIRAAATTSISRPNFSDLVPFRFVNREDDEVTLGNPELDPTRAVNLDVLFETYFQSIGVFGAGFFYKDLEDYIFLRTFDVESGSFAGFEATQPQNAGSGSLWGFEANWSQQLTFLPGLLNGLGLYANYTYTNADVALPGREGDSVLPGQSENLANAAVSYERGIVSARLAYNFIDKFLTEVGDEAAEDFFVDSRSQLDASASVRVHPRVRVFAEMINITNEPFRVIQASADRPVQQEFYSWWGHLGVKVSTP